CSWPSFLRFEKRIRGIVSATKEFYRTPVRIRKVERRAEPGSRHCCVTLARAIRSAVTAKKRRAVGVASSDVDGVRVQLNLRQNQRMISPNSVPSSVLLLELTGPSF